MEVKINQEIRDYIESMCFKSALRNVLFRFLLLFKMTMCFVGNDNHAHSLRKARNSHNTQDEKRIIGIFETKNQKWSKCIYVRDRQEIQKHFDFSLFTESLKKYFRLV